VLLKQDEGIFVSVRALYNEKGERQKQERKKKADETTISNSDRLFCSGSGVVNLTSRDE
jgi:hypothetical protein